jgi:hypothetical protein
MLEAFVMCDKIKVKRTTLLRFALSKVTGRDSFNFSYHETLSLFMNEDGMLITDICCNPDEALPIFTDTGEKNMAFLFTSYTAKKSTHSHF